MKPVKVRLSPFYPDAKMKAKKCTGEYVKSIAQTVTCAVLDHDGEFEFVLCTILI